MFHDVRLIASVGKHGQIGLGAALPWCSVPEHLTEWEETRGGVVLMGWATAQAIRTPSLLVKDGRALALLSRAGLALLDASSSEARHLHMSDLLHHPDRALQLIDSEFPGRTVHVMGGQRVFAAFAPLCHRFTFDMKDFDGFADTYLPQMPWQTPARHFG